jgi:hypothetical protein
MRRKHPEVSVTMPSEGPAVPQGKEEQPATTPWSYVGALSRILVTALLDVGVGVGVLVGVGVGGGVGVIEGVGVFVGVATVVGTTVGALDGVELGEYVAVA